MKILLAVFISVFSLNVSAQWYNKLPWNKTDKSVTPLAAPAFAGINLTSAKLSNTSFFNFNNTPRRSWYSIHAEEVSIMRNLRHSARYGSEAMRIQFDNLANFYFSQNRFSEAKWYMLRSNAIARQKKDYGHIVGSLVALADVKSYLGDFKQADEDLSEAKIIASSHSLLPDLLLIEQHFKQIRINKETGLKPENHYADLL